VSFSNTATHQSITHWCLGLLTLHSLAVVTLLPT
jgi:hypothetical protein